MLKRFFKDTAIYGFSSVISGSLGILLLPYLTHKLTPQEYGVMDLLLSAFTVINVIVPASITQAIARYYPQVDEDQRYIYASTGLWFTFLMYLLFLVLSIVFRQFVTELLIGNKIYIQVLVISLISIFTYGLFYYLQVQLRWRLKVVDYVITNILFVAISCLLTVVFIGYCQMTISGFFWARIIASLLAGALCWYYAKDDYQFVFDKKILKIMLAFSSPLVISSVGIYTSLYVDRFIIRVMLSLTDVGLYSACAKLASIAGSGIAVINLALTPLIYSQYNDPKTPAQIAFIFKMIVFAMLGLIVFLLFFSKKILLWMMGEPYSHCYYVLPLLTASFIVAGLYNCAPGLWIAKKTKLIAVINIASAFLNTILCLIFIPYFGYVGAAIATLISSIATLFASTRYAQKYYYISYDWLKINSAIFLTLLFAYLIIHR
jgi:O-antigen/teichoic acid export membrane protein